MRTSSPLFDPLPPGYSGPPTPPPGSEPSQPDRAPPGEPEVLEDIPFNTEPEPSKIVHETPGLASQAAAAGESSASKIRMFEQTLGGVKHEDNWNRTPNVTGAGAIHVKSFHSKLTGDSLAFLDQQINEWLDAHPQYEVKMVTTSIGTWTGKLKEPNLIVNVWV